MKKHAFTIMILAAALALCGAAWFVRERLLAPPAVQAETQARVVLNEPDPLEGFEVAAPYGPEWDEALGQWSLRWETALRAAPGAFVRALAAGVVEECAEAEDGWTVVVAEDNGFSTRYGGLRAGAATGRRVERGEILGLLRGDTLRLSRQDADGMWIDAVNSR